LELSRISNNQGKRRVQFKGTICLTLLQIGPYVLGPWTPI
jgi:hypothetical protein